MKTILVTGATGNIGGELVGRLARNPGARVRALARSAAKARHLDPGAEVAIGDMLDRAQMRRAAAGADTLVLITPVSADAADQASNVIEAAREAGVTKIVRLSANKAHVDGPTANTRLHGRTEAELVASGLRYVVLRPNRLMQYTLQAIDGIRRDGTIRSGHGTGRLGMVDQRDVIDCLEQAVLTDAQNSHILELTGPESLSFHDVARTLARVLARPVEYVTVPPDMVRATAQAKGLGEWYAQVICDYNQAHREGWGDFTTDAVERMCGHPPRSFETFARDVFAPRFAAAATRGVLVEGARPA